jgi:hypothetical protein
MVDGMMMEDVLLMAALVTSRYCSRTYREPTLCCAYDRAFFTMDYTTTKDRSIQSPPARQT